MCHCHFPQFAKVLIAKIRLSAIRESYHPRKIPAIWYHFPTKYFKTKISHKKSSRKIYESLRTGSSALHVESSTNTQTFQTFLHQIFCSKTFGLKYSCGWWQHTKRKLKTEDFHCGQVFVCFVSMVGLPRKNISTVKIYHITVR